MRQYLTRRWGGFYSREIDTIREHGVIGRRVPDPHVPPVRKCLCWLALCEGSPADFKRKIESGVTPNPTIGTMAKIAK